MRNNAVIATGCKSLNGFGKRQIALALVAMCLLGACAPIIDTRGHTLQSMDTGQIIKGDSHREDVEAVLGSPSAKSTFGDESWYYITVQKETVGIFAPEITKQHVTEITFKKNGTVKDILAYEKEAGKPVRFVEKTTPAAGHSLTFMEQLLGNFGRFGTPGRQIDPTGGR